MAHVRHPSFEDLKTKWTEQVLSVYMALCKVGLHVGEDRRPVLTDLADIGHLPRLVSVLHVLEKDLVGLKGQFTDFADHRRVWCRVYTVNVALQLERGIELAVAAQTGGVDLPSILTPLPLELQVMLGVVHKLDIFQGFRAAGAFEGCVGLLLCLPVSFVLSIIEVTE